MGEGKEGKREERKSGEMVEGREGEQMGCRG